MIKVLSKKIVATAILAASVALISAPVSAGDWKGWNIHGKDYPVGIGMEKFIELASAKTDGRVGGKVFHGGVLGSQGDAISQMQLGGIEFAGFNLGPLGNAVPELNVLSLPFIFKDMEHMHRVMDGETGDILSAAMRKSGIMALSWYDSGARSFYNNKGVVINKPADLKGLKFRVMGNPLYVDMVEALGGNGIPMAYSEVYSSLKTGVIDGAENNWPSFESSAHYEVAGNYSLSQHLILPECICVSVSAFDALSDEDQKSVKEAAVASAVLQRSEWAKRVEVSKAAVLKAGVKFNEIADKAAFQALMAPVYENAIKKNPVLKELIAGIKAVD